MRRAIICTFLLLLLSVEQGAGSGKLVQPGMVLRSTPGGNLVSQGKAQGRCWHPRLLELRGIRGGGSDDEEMEGGEEDDITRRLEAQSLEPSMFDDTPDEVPPSRVPRCCS